MHSKNTHQNSNIFKTKSQKIDFSANSLIIENRRLQISNTSMVVVTRLPENFYFTIPPNGNFIYILNATHDGASVFLDGFGSNNFVMFIDYIFEGRAHQIQYFPSYRSNSWVDFPASKQTNITLANRGYSQIEGYLNFQGEGYGARRRRIYIIVFSVIGGVILLIFVACFCCQCCVKRKLTTYNPSPDIRYDASPIVKNDGAMYTHENQTNFNELNQFGHPNGQNQFGHANEPNQFGNVNNMHQFGNFVPLEDAKLTYGQTTHTQNVTGNISSNTQTQNEFGNLEKINVLGHQEVFETDAEHKNFKFH